MRTILMTGATGGLAQSIISQLPDEDKLILLGRHQERMEELYSYRQKVKRYTVDFQQLDHLDVLLSKIVTENDPIDIVVNNAGFGEFKSFDAFTFEEIKEMMMVNTLFLMSVSNTIGHDMKKRKKGHIINIASMAGLIASSKSTVYSASKFAVIGYSNALRLELAEDNVFVTTVNPGPIKTSFFAKADPSGHYIEKINKIALEPKKVAQKIVNIMGKNKRELNLPWYLNLAHIAYTLFPKLSDYLTRKVFNYK